MRKRKRVGHALLAQSLHPQFDIQNIFKLGGAGIIAMGRYARPTDHALAVVIHDAQTDRAQKLVFDFFHVGEEGREVRDALASRAKEFGVSVLSVGLRDVILPGDMKLILNQVIEAQKQAEANLIRRREETAAARSQANTAKLLAENPALARMKELEALQEILSGTKATFILGQGDLTEQVGRLVARDVANHDA